MGDQDEKEGKVDTVGMKDLALRGSRALWFLEE